RHNKRHCNAKQQQTVENDTWPEYPSPRLGLRQAVHDGLARCVADEAPVVVHFVHDLVAHINACPATNTHVLQAVTNVDTSWADLDTQRAVDAIAHAGFLVVDPT